MQNAMITKRIKEAMKERKVSQEKLLEDISKKCNNDNLVSLSTLQRYLASSDSNVPNILFFKDVCSCLNVSSDYLLGLSDDINLDKEELTPYKVYQLLFTLLTLLDYKLDFVDNSMKSIITIDNPHLVKFLLLFKTFQFDNTGLPDEVLLEAAKEQHILNGKLVTQKQYYDYYGKLYAKNMIERYHHLDVEYEHYNEEYEVYENEYLSEWEIYPDKQKDQLIRTNFESRFTDDELKEMTK